MDALGLLIGSGFPDGSISVLWQALFDGLEVGGGTFVRTTHDFTYHGFSGGTFDELRLRDAEGTPTALSFLDGRRNALTIDSIEVSKATPVPLPAAGWMLLSTVGGLFAARRFRRQA
jgi:hypothetical protein